MPGSDPSSQGQGTTIEKKAGRGGLVAASTPFGTLGKIGEPAPKKARRHVAMATDSGSASQPPGDELIESGFRRGDVVRLMTQCLHSLGYVGAAQALEHDSGIQLMSEPVSRFRAGILDGAWQRVEELVEELGLPSEASRVNVRFLVYRQKYLELVESQDLAAALQCLRQQLAPLDKLRPKKPQSQDDPSPATPSRPDGWAQLASELPELSCYLMCSSAEELYARTGWDGAGGASRRVLLESLQQHVPPSLLLPEGRLQTLLRQAVLWQSSQSLGHCGGLGGRSLFEDVGVSRELIPRETRHVLEKHSDEVWFLQFSHDGSLLASASKDNVVVVWDVSHPQMAEQAVLCGHTDGLSFLAWSPDDTHLLTCAADRQLKLWLVRTSECVRTYAGHADGVTACAWLPDGRHFVSAGVDKKVLLWDVDGTIVQTWHGPRVNDLAVSHCGGQLIAVCSERKIRLCTIRLRCVAGGGGVPELDTPGESVLCESDAITSLSLSRDSRFLLVNVASQETHAWDLHEKQLVHKYRGQKQGRFVIRSSYGGSDEAFVASGSEDSQVYIWNRHTATLLEVLPGHSGAVNAVAWNPRDPGMFASASDDATVRVWVCRGAR